MSFLKNLRNRRDVRRREQAQLAFASLLGPCAACGGSVGDHKYFPLASVIISRQPNSLVQFERLASERNWNDLSAFQEWKGDEDEIVIFAVECPSAGEVTLKRVCDLAELWANSYLMEDIKLNRSEQVSLVAMGEGKWQTITGSL